MHTSYLAKSDQISAISLIQSVCIDAICSFSFKYLIQFNSVCDCRNDWKISRAAAKFTLKQNRVESPVIRVRVPENCSLSYLGLHQRDHRVKGALPPIDLGEFATGKS
jgi:hypothetical protein